MSRSPGDKVGPYEVISLLGAGGMGEVYRASDPRLVREVAIKVLREQDEHDPVRLRRFEQEARAAAGLNHPNVVVVHDFGLDGETPYIVSELLVGRPLRERLREGQPSRREALSIGAQIAAGLAAAHQAGLVHRDLKPGNVQLLDDGRVKIFDFGLTVRDPARTGAPDSTMTSSGAVIGTPAYMAPEQVRGHHADHRSDLFALGTILYEMLSGERAFTGDSLDEVGMAILHCDPPDLPDPVLNNVVRRCLEKNPDDRFQSASEVAFLLETLAISPSSGGPRHLEPPTRSVRRRLTLAAVILLSAALLAAELIAARGAGHAPHHAVAAGRPDTSPAGPQFERLTWRRGNVSSARFAPDRQTVVYSAAWEQDPYDLYSLIPGQRDSRQIMGPGVQLEAVGRAGQLAVAHDLRPQLWGAAHSGTLARTHLSGGEPRDLADDVIAADWLPDGQLVIVRDRRDAPTRERYSTIEWPLGNTVYRSEGTIATLRVSPSGKWVAAVEWLADSHGPIVYVLLVSPDGSHRHLGHSWAMIQGLAWAGDDEVWFAASPSQNADRSLRAVTLDGRQRMVASSASMLSLYDVATDGRALVGRTVERVGIRVRRPNDQREHEYSWFEQSWIRDLSLAQSALVFHEWEGRNMIVFLRKLNGSPAVRLGPGNPEELSPDGRWVLSQTLEEPERLIMLPTGAGQPRVLPRGEIDSYGAAFWFPDGKRILIMTGPESTPSLWIQEIDGGDPVRFATAKVSRTDTQPLSPDGRLVAARNADGVVVFSVAGGPPTLVPGTRVHRDRIVGWSDDCRALFLERGIWRRTEVVDRVEIATGKVTPWRTLTPTDVPGDAIITNIHVATGGRAYAYSYAQVSSDLYLMRPGKAQQLATVTGW